MQRFLDLVRVSLAVDRTAFTPLRGLRAAVGVAMVLGIGVATGQAAPGVFATIGALTAGTVAFTTGARTPYATMLGAGLALGVSTAVGGLTAHALPAELIALVVWGAVAGLASGAGQAPTTVGVQAVVGLVVLGRFPLTLTAASAAAGEVLLGAVVQIVLAALIRLPARDRVERLALADIAAALSAWSTQGGRPTSGQIADRVAAARTLLDRRPATGVGTPLRSLLTGLSRARFEVSVLTQQLGRAAADAHLHAILAAAAEDFAALAAELRSGVPVTRTGDDRLAPLLVDDDDLIAHRAHALAGQLRAAQLSFESWARLRPGPAERLRHAGGWAALPSLPGLRDALVHPSPTAARHAIRLAVLLPVSEGLARALPVQRGYWIALTAVVVLKPDFASSIQRGIARVLGTLGGVVPVSVVVGLAHPRGSVLVVLVGVLAWAAYTTFSAGFALFSGCLAGLVVVLLDVVTPGGASVAGPRALDTLIGGTLALLAYLVFPSWEGPQLAEAVARLVEAEDDYASRVLHAGPDSRAELGAAAGAVRVASAALETAVGHAELEPARLTGTSSAAALRLARDALAANRRIVASLHVLHTQAVEAANAAPAGCAEFAPALHAVLADTARALREYSAFHDEVDLRALARPLVAVAPGSPPAEVTLGREIDEIVDAVDALRFGLADRDMAV